MRGNHFLHALSGPLRIRLPMNGPRTAIQGCACASEV